MSSVDKYSFKSSTAQSPLKKYYESDIDPYSPAIVEDLLQGVNEWRNIQDIVRLTFKALTDCVKSQGETLRELEKQLPTRASKAELNSGLSLKANITDVSKTVAEVASSLDGKMSYDDCQTILKDYVLKSDLQYLLSNKVSIEELRSLLDNKASNNELKAELNSLNIKLEDLQRDVSKKTGTLASLRDVQGLKEALDQKANLADMNEALETKANKQSVANALHRKANRSDIDSLLSRKADLTDIQNTFAALDSKADIKLIDRIAQMIEAKADKGDINLIVNSLSSKADKSEIDILSSGLTSLKVEVEQKMLEELKRLEGLRGELDNNKFSLQNLLSKKADVKEMERVVSQIAKKIDGDELSNSLSKVKNEIYEDMVLLKNELNFQKRYFDENLAERSQKNDMIQEKLGEELYRLEEQLKNFADERTNDIEETAKYVRNVNLNTKKELENELEKMVEDMDTLRKNIEEAVARKLDKKEYFDTRAKLVAQVEDKVDLMEVQNALNACQADISARFMEFKEEVKNLMRNQESDLFNILGKKANLADLNTALAAKADNSIVQSLINQKISINEFDDIRKLVEKLCRELDEKVNFKEFDSHSNFSRSTLEDLQKEVLLKANIKDVCTLLDTKANIDDVNKALTDIHKELDLKSNQDDLNNIVSDQAIINESLCTENIVGRWTWKSGDLKSGSTVPWEVQVVNTLPDNFLWEKDKTSILTVAPGLYEVTFGFFAKKKPTIQLLVNGEPIISAVNTASYVIHHSSGKLKDVKHPSGNITGLTMIDFIVLPARARLSFTYSGEYGGEGFFGLRRL